MVFPVVESVEAVTARFKQLLQQARQIKSSDAIEPPISVADLLSENTLLLSDNIQNQSSHNTVAETAAKSLLHHLVATTTIDDAEFVQVWNLLDIVLICIERGQCDGLLIFYLAEELLDSQSIDGCRKVFDYLESRRERLVAGDFLQKNGASKRIVVLRFCNELLRRLSRAEDAVFCGRVFIFLFQTFPLGDKSSVNSRGEFHVENVTVFEEPSPLLEEKPDEMEIDAQPQEQSTEEGVAASESKNQTSEKEKDKDAKVLDTETLYPIFWTLQQAFSNPPRLFTDVHLAEFKTGVDRTLAKFKDVPKVIQAKANESHRGVKRKHDDAEDQFVSNYNPKYLTSRDLFELELSDLAFQRHILVQALILLDFLLSLTEKSKERTQKWLAQVTSANRAVQYNYTLSTQDAEWAANVKNAIANYLQELPDGKFYYRMVDTVLSRDKNWVRWKMENCPPIIQPPISPPDFQGAKSGAQKACTNKRLRATPMGSLDLSFLNDSAAASGVDSLKDPERYMFPTAEKLYSAAQEDDRKAVEAGEGEETVNALREAGASKTWRALRIASKDRLSMFDKIDDYKQLGALFQPEAGEDGGKDERTGATESTEGKGEAATAAASATQAEMQEEQRPEQENQMTA
ncbi:THO complex subunit 1 transcription elongation factor-domain-containing protein [Phyllosticta capitalensis]|uniref:THO complex subunit 1 transcription elongation factor-domain-containing protein n=1 Tax=Phyllosticta capitalensis TaxID=121624 RepID=A0ABR1YU54_9PEZI